MGGVQKSALVSIECRIPEIAPAFPLRACQARWNHEVLDCTPEVAPPT